MRAWAMVTSKDMPMAQAWRTILVGLCAAALIACGPTAKAASLAEGQSAYNRSKVDEAEKIYAEVAADPAASAKDRSAAQRELGRIAWLIDADAPRALQHLDQAAKAGDEPCRTDQLAARVLREAGRLPEALARVEAGLPRCVRIEEKDELAVEAVRGRLAAAAAAPANARPARLAEAAAALQKLSPEGRTGPAAARARLDIALQTRDAPGALSAWRDYFWISTGDGPQALIALQPQQALQRGLAANAADADRLALLDVLMRAGFTDQAKRFADLTGLTARQPADLIWRRAVANWAVHRRVMATELAVNRDIARGRGGGGRLETEVKASTAELMAAAGASGNPREALIANYNLLGTVGQTSGFPSAHLGHVVQDETLSVDQYGQHADVRFIALENMLANGYESWLWDGSAATGGWADTGPLIVQVRSGYTSGPLRGAAMMVGGPLRAEVEARQAERAAEDLAKLKTQPVAYLRGLSDRLRLQYIDQITAAARAKAGPSGDLRRAFLDEYWDGVIDHSIKTHEGRHALDKTLVKGLARFDDANLEYRAKLSELALSRYPRLAMWNINAETVGGKSPHGVANGKILAAFADWIKANPREVSGLDPAAPPLTQIDKLTDEQMRLIARGLDPLAQKAP
jgi:hypothetical protein